MSDYTPTEEDFIRVYGVDGIGVENQANVNRARRGIAKVKADALREAARAGNIDAASSLYLHDRANQIEDTTP